MNSKNYVLLIRFWKFGLFGPNSLSDCSIGGFTYKNFRPTSPLQDPILSFLHTFSPKSACVRGSRPLKDPHHPPTGNLGSATVFWCEKNHVRNLIYIWTYKMGCSFIGKVWQNVRCKFSEFRKTSNNHLELLVQSASIVSSAIKKPFVSSIVCNYIM